MYRAVDLSSRSQLFNSSPSKGCLTSSWWAKIGMFYYEGLYLKVPLFFVVALSAFNSNIIYLIAALKALLQTFQQGVQ